MIKNYLLIAFRNALRNKAYTLINLLGLAIGITSSIMILLFVLDELSYDRHHEHFREIYRICIRGKIQGNEIEAALSNAPMGATLKTDFPEVEEFTRIFTFDGDPIVAYEERVFIEENFYYVDSTFFQVFSSEVVHGNPEGMLSRPNTVVLTEETARKYFGNEDPVGRFLQVGQEEENFEVTGVVKGFPENSHVRFNMLGSMTSIYLADWTQWLGNNNYTYIRLKEGQDPDLLEAKFPDLIAQHMGTELEEILGLTMEEFLASGNTYGYFLQPLSDIHLRSDLQFEIDPGGSGSRSSVIIFSVIALFLILIASINFMNLATASASRRATEVGIRKLAGAEKNKLVRQFIVESFLITALALILAVVLVELLLPGFNNIAGKGLQLSSLGTLRLVIGLLIIGVFVGFASGSYPAFFLSSFKPVDVLKSGAMRGARGSTLRRILVTFQFVVTIVLFICTILVNRQMNYLQDKDLGFNKENLVVIDRVYVLEEQIEAFRQELLKNPAIRQVTVSSAVPGGLIGDNAFLPEGASTNETHAINNLWCDWYFQETYELELVEGRWFQKDNPTDSSALILSESAVRALSFDDPLNEGLYAQFGEDTNEPHHIIGVVKDFNFQSLHQEIRPLVIQFNSRNFYQMTVKISDINTGATLDYMENIWNSFKERQPIHMTFLEEELAALYNNEQKAAIIFNIFSILAIFIAALGLLGLASFSAAQRTKEVGIRKAMGASIASVLLSLSREYIWLILLATVLAWPLGYFYMKDWLQDYPARVALDPVVFVISSLMAFFIAAVTVLLRVYQSASANPVKSLRYE